MLRNKIEELRAKACFVPNLSFENNGIESSRFLLKKIFNTFIEKDIFMHYNKFAVHVFVMKRI